MKRKSIITLAVLSAVVVVAGAAYGVIEYRKHQDEIRMAKYYAEKAALLRDFRPPAGYNEIPHCGSLRTDPKKQRCYATTVKPMLSTLAVAQILDSSHNKNPRCVYRSPYAYPVLCTMRVQDIEIDSYPKGKMFLVSLTVPTAVDRTVPLPELHEGMS